MPELATLVVTGSAQGIGRAVSELAGSRGYRVVGIDVNEAGGEETAELVRSAGGEATFRRCDLADPEEIARVFAEIAGEVGPIDALVNNAAVGSHTAPERLTAEEWHRVIDVSLGAMVFASQAVGREMIRDGRTGAIVNLSSIGGLAALGRGNYAYSIAKAGIIGLTRELSVEWAAHGIRVNAVAPSQVNTEGFRPLIEAKGVAGGNTLRDALSGVPLRRLAEPEEIANAILFLLSEEASFITGVTLPVDGGSMALHAGGSLRELEEE
jgi:NAD(P)-dependent dehydrogenase (short-subunit alcohol dehydrogenase family)